MRRPLLALALSAGVGLSNSHQPQTGAAADGLDARRRCPLPETATAREAHAVHCAEWFIARQGYTVGPPVDDSALIVPEGIEWTASLSERLAERRGSLQAQAFGVCARAEGGFDVAFRYASGAGVRGVTMDAGFGSLRVVHEDFDPASLIQRQAGCHPLADASAP